MDASGDGTRWEGGDKEGNVWLGGEQCDYSGWDIQTLGTIQLFTFLGGKARNERTEIER